MEWQNFVRDGNSAVQSLLGKQESLSLEFKSNHPKDPTFVDGELTGNGKRIIAREISAFANSAGGLLVLGVDCRNVNGVDEAQELVPISNLSKAETSVRTAAAELLQPRHDSIEVIAIPSTSTPGAGYIVVNVPRSERRPHRSEARNQKEYFKRSGASVFAMEHYDIEDAFKRQSSPILSIDIEFGRTMKSGADSTTVMRLAMVNSGDISAKSVTLQIWNQVFQRLRTHPAVPLTSSSTFDGKWTLAAAADFMIHPGQTRVFEELFFRVSSRPSGELFSDGSELIPGSISFDYSIGAENMRAAHGRFELDRNHLNAIKRAIAK